jgi:hypothetical protein
MCAFFFFHMFLSLLYGRFDNEKRKRVVTLEIVKRGGQTQTWKERRIKKFSELPLTV